MAAVKMEIDGDNTDVWLKDWAEPEMPMKEEINLKQEEESILASSNGVEAKAAVSGQQKDAFDQRNRAQPNDQITEDAASMVEFKCPACDYVTKLKSGLQRHFSKTSHGPNKLSKTKALSYTTKLAYFRCKECLDVILAESVEIGHHLSHKNKMGAIAYRNKYNIDDPKKLRKAPDLSSINAEMVRLMYYKQSEKGLADTSQEYQHDESSLNQTAVGKTKNEILITENTFGLIELACRMCGFKTRRINGLRKHFLNASHGSVSLTRSETFRYITKLAFFKCKECQKEVLAESDEIASHLKTHKMRCKAYRIKHGTISPTMSQEDAEEISSTRTFSNDLGNMCEYKCRECVSVHSTVGGMINHLATNHGIQHVHILPYMDLKVFHKCRLCNKAILCDIQYLRRHFSQKHSLKSCKEYCQVTGCQILGPKREYAKVELLKKSRTSKDVRDLCEYSCKFCKSRTFSNWRAMLKHISFCHPKNRQHCLDKSQFIKKCVSYQCSLCSELLFCDRSVIKVHINGKHKMKVNEYLKAVGQVETPQVTHTYFDRYKMQIKAEPTFRPQEETILPPGTIPRENLASLLGNLCRYKCPSCPFKMARYYSLFQISRHLKSVHGQGFKYKKLHTSIRPDTTNV